LQLHNLLYSKVAIAWKELAVESDRKIDELKEEKL